MKSKEKLQQPIMKKDGQETKLKHEISIFNLYLLMNWIKGFKGSTSNSHNIYRIVSSRSLFSHASEIIHTKWVFFLYKINNTQINKIN